MKRNTSKSKSYYFTLGQTHRHTIGIGPDPFAKQMVSIQGGTFWMGSSDDEYRHQVTVSSFKMSKYEVTKAQWEAIMGNNHSHFIGCPQCPVEQVSWDDIQKFLQKLNAQTGKNYRLPTEAEWEYAARGGNKSKGYQYAGSNNIDEVAWYNGNSGNTTHPVGTKLPNELGLYDMSGNVWEWCKDKWHDTYEGIPLDGSAWEDEATSLHVLRGGSWVDSPDCCRISHRDFVLSRCNYVGFRLAHDCRNPH